MILWIFIGLFIISIVFAGYLYEKNGKHASKLMHDYLGKKWLDDNPSTTVIAGKKKFTFYFNIDNERIIRGVLFKRNMVLSEAEKRVEKANEDSNNISDKVDKNIMGEQYKSIRIIYKGMKYVSYWLEDDNDNIQSYMEDRNWKNSMAKKAGLKGITNPLWI